MKIALISDVHLEYNIDKPFSLPKANILVCAGDIGSPFALSYKNFLKKVSKKYNTVIVISGNHEYYSQSPCQAFSNPKTMLQTEEHIRNLCKECGCIYLQKETYDMDGLRFYGCTLWGDPINASTYFDCGNIIIDDHEKLWKSRHDSKYISDLECLDDYISLHNNHKEWLLNEISKPTSKTKIVITHHLPSLKLIEPKYSKSPTNGYYASECEELVSKSDLWLAGHTHKYIETKICGEIPIYCNPICYPWEHKDEYNSKLVINV